MSTAEVLSKLPPDLQALLRKKCSRDPKTRFTHKIESLLAFVTANPVFADDLGIGWVSEYEFRMNKKVLVDVLGIKLNSMNVNLHDLGFHKLRQDKNGWSCWTRTGLTQHRVLALNSPDFAKPRRVSPITFPGLTLNFSLGAVQRISCDHFINNVVKLWMTVINPDINAEVFPPLFVDHLANALRTPEQPFANAVSVLAALLLFGNPKSISIVDFVMFLARFGPSETVMLKIASLVSATGDGCKCISFGPGTPLPEDAENLPFFGVFDDKELNRLSLSFPHGQRQCVWNVPLVDAYGCYLVDDTSKTYRSWVEYFEQKVKVRL
jgi:hypothetical protein